MQNKHVTAVIEVYIEANKLIIPLGAEIDKFKRSFTFFRLANKL